MKKIFIFILSIFLLMGIVNAGVETLGASWTGQGAYTKYVGSQIYIKSENIFLVSVQTSPYCGGDTAYIFDTEDNNTVVASSSVSSHTAIFDNTNLAVGKSYIIVTRLASSGSFNPDYGTVGSYPVSGTDIDWEHGIIYDYSSTGTFEYQSVAWCIAGVTLEQNHVEGTIDSSDFNGGLSDGWQRHSTGAESCGADFSHSDFRSGGSNCFSQYYKDLSLNDYGDEGLNISVDYTFDALNTMILGFTNSVSTADYSNGEIYLQVSPQNLVVVVGNQSAYSCSNPATMVSGDTITWLIYPDGTTEVLVNDNSICSGRLGQIPYSNMIIYSRYDTHHLDNILVQTINKEGEPSPKWFCDGYDTCSANYQSCNSVTDANICGDVYSGDYSEFPQQYCGADLNVAGIGDSITGSLYGYLFFLNKIEGIATHNYGIGGEQSSQILNRISDVIGKGYNWTILLVGTNDAYYGVSLDAYKTTVSSIVDNIKADNQQVLLSTVPPCGRGSCVNAPLYNQVLNTVSYEKDVCLADIYNDVFGGTLNPLLYADDVHPNGYGHSGMNATYYDAIVNGCSPYDCQANPTECYAYIPENETCTPDWSCNGYDSCSLNNTEVCNNVTDLNTCGEVYAGDYSEFTPQVCDYCTPSWSCSSYAPCLINNTKVCNVVEDQNTCGESYAGDYSEFLPQACVYVVGNETYVPSHTSSDIGGVVIDFFVEFGVKMIALAGLVALIGFGIWAYKKI